MIEATLLKLGFTEKEAKIYLANLELGAATAAMLAKKTGVNRATTYLAIESLKKRGLISTVEKFGKHLFITESPDRLLELVLAQEKQIEENKRKIVELLPELTEIYNHAPERPKVRLYEGVEGIKTIQKEMLDAPMPLYYEVTSLDEAYKIFPPHPADHRAAFLKKLRNVPSRIIYTYSQGPKQIGKGIEDIYLKPEDFRFNADLILFGGDRIAFIPWKGKIFGIVIESKELHDAMRALLDKFFEDRKTKKKSRRA